MKKLLVFGVVLVICFTTFSVTATPAYSDELDELNKQINELQAALEASKKATTPLESQATSMKKQLDGIEYQIGQIEKDIVVKKDFITKGYADLEDQKNVFNQTVREYYMKHSLFSPLLMFLSSTDAASVTRLLAYQQKDANQDKSIITNTALKITELETTKEKLEKEEKQLSVLKAKLAKDRAEIEKVVAGAKSYQASLSGQIADLSAKQQEIINAKSGSYTFSLGNGELADEYLSSLKGFRESAPSGSFGIFSFGGYTHRKGMSQYGARGRAQAGQDFKTILKAYYGKEPVNKDTGGTIKVAGHGEMDFETTYLWGIAEMPSSWHPEALKAQAVAARTYAYRYKAEGKEICTTEACQVFNKGKSDNAPDSWKQAVESTKGQVLEDVVTYYASTHGGFASPIGWDTTDGQGGANFIDRAWDKAGGSPWLYKAWWRQHYSNSGATCGRANPWFNNEEMADIVNAIIVPRDDRITPVTTDCWGGNPYSMAELRDKGGVTSVSNVTVLQGNGSSNEVVFQTNKGEVRVSASEFKEKFNLRAPGYVRIPQTGFSFFNIEKK
ncbi:MAG TPA: SpoIID/LytB domain-containing protein [Candidatus Levybacteria bacterium]|nr:SpoIID/LytB domain-containing protein [Candidatus Levybacteria bacterium]